MIKTLNLTKQYGKIPAVNKVNLEIKRGEFFGFIGPNGAGKTTTIKMITGLIKPSLGTASIGGFDITKEPLNAKALFGYVPDQPNIYDKLTAREFLTFMADLYSVNDKNKIRKTDELLDIMSLREHCDEYIQGYSHGMKQKTALAGALIHDPRVLFLDEPLVGLDPKSARMIKDILKGLCRKGVTVFMSTHVLEVAEKLCDRIGIISRGSIVAIGTVDEIKKRSGVEGSSLEEVFLQITGEADSEEVARFLDALS